MRRLGGLIALTVATLPATVHAQARPSNSMHTRSAEVYLDRANRTSREPERTDLLNKALEALTQGMQSDANNPRVWFLAGQTYIRLGDAVGADSAFDRAQTLYGEYAADIDEERLALWIAKYNQGVAALQAGDAATGTTYFEAAHAVYQGRPDAAISLASLYAQAGDLAKAESTYRAALAIAQGPASQMVPANEREAWLEQEALAATRLASLLAQTGKAAAAIEVYRALVKSQPSNGAAKAELAAVLADAGQADEATRTYEELLGSGDLAETEWFNAGVRLYSAKRYDLAARAFHKALEKNPHSRDAWYNLGQAIYAASAEVEEEKKTAPDARQAELAARLEQLSRDLLDVGTRLRDFDPHSRNGLLMTAQAQRTLADLSADAAKTEWQQKVVATLEEAENMPFEVSGVETRPGDGTFSVNGRLSSLKLPAGQTVTLEFTLLGEGGAAVATESVTITTQAAGTPVPFEFRVTTDRLVLGWKYRVAA